MKTQIREYLAANMFDGNDEGELTTKTSRLLDDVSELMAQYIMQQPGGTSQFVPLVGLPSGPVISISKILFIARKEINQYVVFFEGSPQGALIDRADMKAMAQFGILQQLPAPDKAPEAAKVVQLVKAE